jgi:hypothetical protein
VQTAIDSVLGETTLADIARGDAEPAPRQLIARDTVVRNA